MIEDMARQNSDLEEELSRVKVSRHYYLFTVIIRHLYLSIEFLPWKHMLIFAQAQIEALQSESAKEKLRFDQTNKLIIDATGKLRSIRSFGIVLV